MPSKYHVLITNINHNQVNDTIYNELKFYGSNNLVNNTVEDSLTILTIMLRGGKYSRQTFKSGLTYLWVSGDTDSMINRNHIKPYKSKLRANKVNYSTSAGPYKTTHYMEVPFCVPDFSVENNNTYSPRKNARDDEGIVYDIILGRDLIIQLGLKVEFSRQVLEWYGTVEPIKDPGNFHGQPDLTKCEIQEVVMQTV